MSRLWDQPGIPHKGWRPINVEDLQETQGECYDPETCEMCGQESLRYVHTMRHNDYDDLRVGCICAGHMANDKEGAREREKRVANLSKRRGKWLTRQWRRSRSGNEFLNVDGHNVAVFPDKFNTGKWKYKISDGEDVIWGPKKFNTINEAKLALFNALAEQLGWK